MYYSKPIVVVFVFALVLGYSYACSLPDCFYGENCTFCPPGSGVGIVGSDAQACGVNGENTLCIPCKPNTYSNTNDSYSRCIGCMQCYNEKEIMIQPCTSTRNTFCGCKKGYVYNTIVKSCLRGEYTTLYHRGTFRELNIVNSVLRKNVRRDLKFMNRDLLTYKIRLLNEYVDMYNNKFGY